MLFTEFSSVLQLSKRTSKLGKNQRTHSCCSTILQAVFVGDNFISTKGSERGRNDYSIQVLLMQLDLLPEFIISFNELETNPLKSYHKLFLPARETIGRNQLSQIEKYHKGFSCCLIGRSWRRRRS